jgi:hypothetical protein
MALLLLAGAGYAYYEAQRGQNAKTHVAVLDPSLNLDDKTAIELLPHERGGGLFSTSTTTITFYKGDYRQFQQVLQQRVDDILASNPWLGEWWKWW